MAFGTLLSVIAVTGNVAAAESSQWFNWTKLSNPREIIDVDGYRLATAGDVLIALPMDGNRPEATLTGDDAGHRPVRVLAYPEAAWQEANVGEAGTTISFVGAALMSYGEQVLCPGGKLDGRATDTAFSLQYVNGSVDVVYLPPLPEPITGGCGKSGSACQVRNLPGGGGRGATSVVPSDSGTNTSVRLGRKCAA